MRTHGLWAIVVSVLAPPPFPTKLVVLAAGVVRTDRLRFSTGVFTGRLIRYSVIGYLAARFGNRAAQILKDQYPTISLILVACILIALLIRILKNRA